MAHSGERSGSRPSARRESPECDLAPYRTRSSPDGVRDGCVGRCQASLASLAQVRRVRVVLRVIQRASLARGARGHLVGLVARCGEHGLPGPPASELGLNVGLRQREAGRDAIDDAADTLAVRLTYGSTRMPMPQPRLRARTKCASLSSKWLHRRLPQTTTLSLCPSQPAASQPARPRPITTTRPAVSSLCTERTEGRHPEDAAESAHRRHATAALCALPVLLVHRLLAVTATFTVTVDFILSAVNSWAEWKYSSTFFGGLRKYSLDSHIEFGWSVELEIYSGEMHSEMGGNIAVPPGQRHSWGPEPTGPRVPPNFQAGSCGGY